MELMEQKLLSTGLPALDKELDGGLFSGSLVYMRIDPSAMAELFLYHFLQQRPTYYVNTERKPEFIIRNMENAGFKTNGIRFIDIHRKYHEPVEKLLNSHGEMKDSMILHHLKKELEAIHDTDANLIIDTITFFLYLNVKVEMIRELVDVIYETTKKMDGLGFLFGLKGAGPSLIENEVINLCDVVLDFSIEKKLNKTITEVIVPKARDRPIRGNVLRFKIEKGVIMDTTREIA